MNAWAKSFEKESGVKLTGDDAKVTLLGDASGKFIEALGIEFDASPLLGNKRAKRSAISVEDGKVTKVAVEPENTPVTVSGIDQFLA
jgi:peroxiredoxin 5